MTSPFADQIRVAINSKTKPVGALGRIEDLAFTIAMLQHSLKPATKRCHLTIFAGDHGLANEGVSAFPQVVTRQMVLNFLDGGAAANVFARSVGADIQVVDAGICGPRIDHPALVDRRIADGTANSLRGAAMLQGQLDAALDAGAALTAAHSHDTLCFGEMGIANTSAASLVASKILEMDIGHLVGRGTGVDDAKFAHKAAVLISAASRTPAKLSPREALLQYGGFEIAMMCGAMIKAAKARKLVIVDGFIASTAALCAARIDEQVRPALVFAHRSAELGHSAVLESLKAEPLFDLGMRLGEGTGALLAWPLVQAAGTMLRDMASFEDAGVAGKS